MPALRTRDTQSKSLEVTTDAPQPPTLAIISPTPRAFTFPITHNLSDSPYSSPSHSPFEPDLHPLSLQCTVSQSTTTPPPPPFMRTLSPDTPARTSSPASPTHKRRKSSCSSDIIERRPKKGDEDYIKRPENAFILFRRKCCEDRQQAQEEAAREGPAKKQRQADLSKSISQQWKCLSAEERQFWEHLAKEKKKEHEQMYPNYVYRPQRAKDKDTRSKSKKVKGRQGEFDRENDSETMSFVLPMPPRHHGRSASAPTPPPYQSIQIPNVYQMTPSCPTSPSLLPMISRRSSHPNHPEGSVSNFDYLPCNNNFLPLPFGQAGQFEASLQSSEFLRNMFAVPPRNDASQHHQGPIAPDSQLLPAHQISPVSSGPSSPSSGPFTPTTMLSHSYPAFSVSDAHGCSAEPQTVAEFDLQMEMQQQQQQDYSNYWGSGSFWPPTTDMLLNDDFDINSIPPIEIGIPKYDMGLSGESAAGLDFGHDFTQALEGSPFTDDSQNIDSLLGFDEIMAGHGF